MVNTDKLLGVMAERHRTRKDVAEALGITPKTFSAKMNKGVFGSNEIETMIKYLEIAEPMPIFFADR